MNGIIINIDPVIFRLGAVEIRWYSLAIMLAVVAAVFIASREARLKGIKSDEIYSLLPWVLVAGIAGARLFHVIDRWDLYSGNLMRIFQFQQGGLAIWGALVGGGLAAVIYAKIRHLPVTNLLDALVPALLAAQIIGRFGCIVNGDAWGAATTLPWGFIYVHPSALIPSDLLGVPTHPYPVYEMLWNLAALALVFRFKGKFKHSGTLSLAFVAHYSLVRFCLSFVRQEKTILFGLQQAQLLAIVGLVASLALLAFILVRAGHAGRVGNGMEVRG